MLAKNKVSPQDYRDTMARFAGAVHVITTDGPAGRRGTTVIAACSVSDDPATILVCLNRHNPNNDLFVENGIFALNTLSAHHESLSVAFAGLDGKSQDERFAMADWTQVSTGAPVLTDAQAVFDCELLETREIATHRVMYGKVTGLAQGDSLSPLLYFNRAYRHL